MRHIVFAGIVMLLCTIDMAVYTCSARAQQGARDSLSITVPTEGGNVPQQLAVEGRASRPTATVWVIVHPTAIPQRWVQQSAKVRKDGTWRVTVYVGDPGPKHVGQHFEIMAVIGPTVHLATGLVLDEWPEAESSSEIVEVVRR
jgi:hypothetical protein